PLILPYGISKPKSPICRCTNSWADAVATVFLHTLTQMDGIWLRLWKLSARRKKKATKPSAFNAESLALPRLTGSQKIMIIMSQRMLTYRQKKYGLQKNI